jgi:hypothetical protein
MAGQTKMIVITSNEDLIRQISFNKTKNTHIIDLDDDNQLTSIAKDNNNIKNLSFLAGLTQPVCILILIKSMKITNIYL